MWDMLLLSDAGAAGQTRTPLPAGAGVGVGGLLSSRPPNPTWPDSELGGGPSVPQQLPPPPDPRGFYRTVMEGPVGEAGREHRRDWTSRSWGSWTLFSHPVPTSDQVPLGCHPKHRGVRGLGRALSWTQPIGSGEDCVITGAPVVEWGLPAGGRQLLGGTQQAGGAGGPRSPCRTECGTARPPGWPLSATPPTSGPSWLSRW